MDQPNTNVQPLSRKKLYIILGITVLLLVVATILLNPGRRMADERNNVRIENMGQIVEGITEYAKANKGVLPKGIPVSDNCPDAKYEICKVGDKECKGVVLDVLVNDDYMEFMPKDPRAKRSEQTAYNIVQSEKGRITVCAPKAELGRTLDYIK